MECDQKQLAASKKYWSISIFCSEILLLYSHSASTSSGVVFFKCHLLFVIIIIQRCISYSFRGISIAGSYGGWRNIIIVGGINNNTIGTCIILLGEEQITTLLVHIIQKLNNQSLGKAGVENVNSMWLEIVVSSGNKPLYWWWHDEMMGIYQGRWWMHWGFRLVCFTIIPIRYLAFLSNIFASATNWNDSVSSEETMMSKSQGRRIFNK